MLCIYCDSEGEDSDMDEKRAGSAYTSHVFRFGYEELYSDVCVCVCVCGRTVSIWCFMVFTQVPIRCAHVDPPPLLHFYHEMSLLSTLASSVRVCTFRKSLGTYSTVFSAERTNECVHDMLPGCFNTHTFPQIARMQGRNGRSVRAPGFPYANDVCMCPSSFPLSPSLLAAQPF